MITLTIALSLSHNNSSSINIESEDEVTVNFTEISREAKILQKSFLSWGNPTLGDFNNDGYLDFIIQGHYNRPAFYRNNGDGTFDDIFNETGIPEKSSNGVNIDRHGFAWGDYNNDGILDLYIAQGACKGACAGQKQDELLAGDGLGRFVDITNAAGTTNSFGRGRSASWIDYNNDGLLDLFVLNIKTASILYKNNGGGTFTDVTQEAGLVELSGLVNSWADYNNDGYMDLLVTAPKDRLFKNNGDGTFTDVTTLAGLKGESNGRGIAWGDYNNDGYLDLFIAREYPQGRDNVIWNSQRIAFLAKFEETVSGESQSHTIDFTTNGTKVTFDFQKRDRGSKWTEISFTLNNTQGPLTPVTASDAGYFISNDDNGAWHLRFSQDNRTEEGKTDDNIEEGTNEIVFWGTITSDGSFMDFSSSMSLFKEKENDLYGNNRDGTFTDATKQANLEHLGNHNTGIWGDYDNDGWLDLYVVDSGDISRSKPNLLYHNNGDRTFTDVANREGVSADNTTGRHGTAAWGDLDNDGFLDLLLKNGDEIDSPLAHGSVLLYKNHGNDNHWLEIKLVGQTSNRLAIGTGVMIDVGGEILYRQLNSGGGGDFFSQGYTPLHFGLGENTSVDNITINWSSGITQKISNVPADQIITIHESIYDDIDE